MTPGQGLTRVRFYAICTALVLVGVTATVSADYAGEMAGNIIKELGPGLFTAGILGLLVDPFFRRELARDAFLASFRYVLPNEFKDEVEKILRFQFVAEKQLWTVKIDKINGDDDTVLVTTPFDKTVKNRSKSSRKNRGYYTVPDFSFSNGKSAVLDCKIEYGNKKEENFETTNPTGMELEAATRELDIKPEGVARISGKATQFRRVNDFVFETFLTPAINPEIEVIMPDGFDHIVKFGTIGDYTREAYADRYTLSGVYFPGQFMFVRWLPRFR